MLKPILVCVWLVMTLCACAETQMVRDRAVDAIKLVNEMGDPAHQMLKGMCTSAQLEIERDERLTPEARASNVILLKDRCSAALGAFELLIKLKGDAQRAVDAHDDVIRILVLVKAAEDQMAKAIKEAAALAKSLEQMRAVVGAT